MKKRKRKKEKQSWLMSFIISSQKSMTLVVIFVKFLCLYRNPKNPRNPVRKWKLDIIFCLFMKVYQRFNSNDLRSMRVLCLPCETPYLIRSDYKYCTLSSLLVLQKFLFFECTREYLQIWSSKFSTHCGDEGCSGLVKHIAKWIKKNLLSGADLDHVTYGLWRIKIFPNCCKSSEIVVVLVLILILIQIWRTRKSFLNPPLCYEKSTKDAFISCVNKV